jgi:DNA mismatch repair protein MutS2
LETEFRPGWEDVSPGDQVKVEGIERPVLVAQKDERRKRLSILIGDLQSEVPFERVLQKIRTPSPQQHLETASVRISSLHKSDIPGEINLIGMTVEEMEPVLQKYLDDAALSGWDGVRIIHGHGTGILRNAVRRLIKGHPQVARFQEAESFEGGAGATVAVLRK